MKKHICGTSVRKISSHRRPLILSVAGLMMLALSASAQTAAGIVYQQPSTWKAEGDPFHGLPASYDTSGTGYVCLQSFKATSSQLVNKITWRGTYIAYNGSQGLPSNTDTWHVNILSSSATAVSNTSLSASQVTTTNLGHGVYSSSVANIGVNVYEYSMAIHPFQTTAGASYYVSVTSIPASQLTTASAFFYWAQGSGGNGTTTEGFFVAGASSSTHDYSFDTNFVLSVTAGAPTSLSQVSGDKQTASAGAAFASPLVVRAVDANNLEVQGATVSFTVTGGSATLSAPQAVTGADGTASVKLIAGSTAGPVSVSAKITSNPALSTTFSNLTVNLAGPTVSTAYFVSPATLQPGLSPCSLGAIYGPGILPADAKSLTAQAAGDGTYAASLGAVDSIAIGGVVAPINSLVPASTAGGNDLVTFQTPCETPVGTVSATVSVSGVGVQVDGINVTTYQPGLFQSVGADGQMYAVAFHPDGSQVNLASPAMQGETVRFLAAGAGQTTPPIVTNLAGVDGQLVSGRLSGGVNDGGVIISLAQYGSGMLGVYTLDFQIPCDTATGGFQDAVFGIRPDSGDPIFSNTVYLPITTAPTGSCSSNAGSASAAQEAAGTIRSRSLLPSKR